MDKNNYVLGRGEVWIDGRYIGNTELLRFGMRFGRYRIDMLCNNISMENLKMFFSGRNIVNFKYVPYNPVGKNFAFEIDKVEMQPAKFNVKGDEWQGLAFELIVPEKGSISNRIRIYEKPAEETNGPDSDN